MEMPQSSLNLDEEEDIELLIEEQLMKDIEAVMSGRRIDEVTGELTTAPLGDEYIMQKLQSVKPEVSDEDDDDDDDERDDFGIWPKNPQDRLAVKNFMRGCKTNPYPERGSIIKLKLSEGVEDVKMEGGKTQTLVVENHIQLDYDTGSWAHIKIHRNLHGMVVPIAQSKNKKRKRN